jgi:TPP-dependent pyruvate/acetoin dehydrogenase alpha subunit
MKRFPAFDPPEYAEWTLVPEELERFRAALRADPARTSVVASLDEAALLALYAGLLRARLQDIALKRWVRQGVLSKAWLGTGEEATTVGPVHALQRDRDIVAPMIRNNAACAEMGMPIADGFRAYLAAASGPSHGRDLHAGDIDHGVLQPISHVGDMVPVAAGVALAFKLQGEPRVALVWIGDGSTKTGTVHEGLNLAAVQRVPAIFVVQNNQVALGTRLEQYHLSGRFDELAGSYGMGGTVFDGNNVLDALAATRIAAERCRAGEGPFMLVAETFRMGGHATHDEREARDTFPREWFERWGRRDPVGLYEEYLKGEGVAEETLTEIESEIAREVDRAADEALASRDHPTAEDALRGVYALPSA